MVMKILNLFKGKVDKLLEELQNPNEDKRDETLKVLSGMNLSVGEGLKILEACKKEFPKSKFEWKDISEELIRICAAKPYSEYVLKVENIYEELNPNGKIAAFNFLASYENEQALISYLKLLEKDYDKLMSLPSGNLDIKPRNSEILFPRLLKFTENKNIAADIYMILLTYFNNGFIKEEQIKDSKAGIVSDIVDMAQRIMDYKFNESDESIWKDDNYLDIRYRAGVYFDLAGHIHNAEISLCLRSLMQVKDMRLKMFAAISLIRLGEDISSEDALDIAADSEVRNWFYDNLERLNKIEVFPEKYTNQEAFAESNMVDWLIYPTELGRVPDEIELMRVFEDEEEEYYLFRFRSNSEDWKEAEWMAGVSGPFRKEDIPTTSAGGYTFSRFDKWDIMKPEEHFDAIVGNVSEYWMKRAEDMEK